MEEKPIDWHDEGKKAFVHGKVKPDHPPLIYPTRDRYSAEDEADYVAGWNSAKNAFERGEGFAGLESYAAELDAERAREAQIPPS